METQLRLFVLPVMSFLFVSGCSGWPFGSKVNSAQEILPAVAVAKPVEKKPATEKPAIEASPIEKPVVAESMIVSPVVQSPVPEKPAVVKQELVKIIAPAPAVGKIRGKVILLGKDNKELPANDVIVTLEPLSDEAKTYLTKNAKSQPHTIKMEGKKYIPSAITVKTGDEVFFNNKDAIKHNVFSSTGKNAFDLGTYGLGGNKSVKLVAPGVVKVYCNIHIEMVTFVAVSPWNTSVITQANGLYELRNLPVGEYNLSIWHIRGETSRRISVKAGDNGVKDIVLNTVAFKDTPHLNKFGEAYKVKPTLFQDEFY